MKRILFALVVVILAVIASVPKNQVIAQGDIPFNVFLPFVSKPVEPYKLDGLNFSPYMTGQSPDWGTQIPEDQIRVRLSVVAPHTEWVRTFGCGDGLEAIGRISHEMGLKVAVGAWIGTDPINNTAQLNCAIEQANQGHADMVVVGSEALLRNDVGYDQLVAYVRTAQQQIPANIPVTYGDVYGIWLTFPDLANEVDLIFANIYSFWEGYPIDQALAVTDHYYNELVTTFPGKTVNISEAGWPSCGNYGDAVGSVENEAAYFNQLISWERAKNVNVFYFSSFDEEWKAIKEGPQGTCWGLWDKDGVLKPGMQPVFDGYSVPFNISVPKTCNTDTQSLEFTYVPPIGSFDNITGEACGVTRIDYRVTLFIQVWGSWYVRPWGGDQAYTPISEDGSWTVDYTNNGGVDENVSGIRAYLIPKTVDPERDDLTIYPMIEVYR